MTTPDRKEPGWVIALAVVVGLVALGGQVWLAWRTILDHVSR